MSAEFIDNCEPWAILHDYYHGEALFTPEAGDEFLAVRKHPLDPATFMKHLKRIRSLIARLQSQQDAEDSRCEKVGMEIPPGGKPAKGMPSMYDQSPRPLDQRPSIFRHLPPKTSSHEHEKGIPSNRPFDGPIVRKLELLDAEHRQRLPPPPPPCSSQLHQLQLSPEERQSTVQAKIHSNANKGPNITTLEDCAKPHRAPNGLRTQEETAPPISQKGTKSPSRREDSKTVSHHDVAPANGPPGLPSLPKNSPPSIKSKPVLRSPSRPTAKQTSAPQLVDIDLNGKKSPTTQENNDQDGWNVVDATEDGYAAVEMEHAADMEGPIEFEHCDDGGDWDLCE
ncbi:hypothetical protein XANCAGTX0491_000500 [Xanthoria calcicola]